MATTNRRQIFAGHHVGRSRNRPDELKAARRRTTDDRDHAQDHHDDHDTEDSKDIFSTSRRATDTHTCIPALRHRQSIARQQQTSAREEYHDNPLQEHIHAYKTQLVDDLNAQMNRADDAITQRMDELSGEFEGRLKVIDEAGGKFWASLGEERVQIGTNRGEDNISGQEVSLEEVMADLKTLMEEKRAKLTVLTEEYTRVHRESVKLAIAILGEEKVLVQSEPSITTPRPERTTSDPQKDISNPLIDTIAARQANESFEQVYDDAKARLTDLQSTLDELVERNLEENKGALKALQASRKVKQGELNCLC